MRNFRGRAELSPLSAEKRHLVDGNALELWLVRGAALLQRQQHVGAALLALQVRPVGSSRRGFSSMPSPLHSDSRPEHGANPPIRAQVFTWGHEGAHLQRVSYWRTSPSSATDQNRLGSRGATSTPCFGDRFVCYDAIARCSTRNSYGSANLTGDCVQHNMIMRDIERIAYAHKQPVDPLFC